MSNSAYSLQTEALNLQLGGLNRDRSLIRKALRSLFDGDKPSLMYEWHKQYVRGAYPYSYAFAFCFSRAVDE